jgi:hypothetical protein
MSAHLEVNLIESEWTTSNRRQDAYDLVLGLATAPIHNIEEHVLPNFWPAGRQNEI